MAIEETLRLNTADAERVIGRLERELEQVGKVTLDFDTAEFDRFRNLNLSVDADTSKADAELRDLRAQLGDMDLTLDTGVAVSELQQVGRAVDVLDRDLHGLDLGEVEGIDELNADLRRLRTTARNTAKGLDDVGGGSAKLGQGVGAATAQLRAFFAVAAGSAVVVKLGQALRDAIGDYTNLTESVNKARVVFGEGFEAVDQFATGAAQSAGLARGEALELTASLGNLLRTAGLTSTEAADLSVRFAQLGADLSSFNNIPVPEALEKIRSGLVGETEPLRTLGVLLSEARIQAEAAALGLGGLNRELSEAEKVQARASLIFKDTATAQGDFARTADSAANASRSVAAEFQNISEKVGEALLPVLQAVIDAAPELQDALRDLIPQLKIAASSVAGLVDELAGMAAGLVDAGFTAGLFFAGLKALINLDFDRFAQVSALADLNQSIKEGVDAADAFATVLLRLVEANQLTEESFDQLIAVSGLADDELAAGIRAAHERAQELGVTNQFIDVLIGKEADLVASERRLGAGFAASALAQRNFVAAAKTVIQPMTDIEAKAAEAGVSLSEFTQGLIDTGDESFRMVSPVEKTALALAELEGAVRASGEAFAETGEGLSGVVDAFTGAADQVDLSVDEFLENAENAVKQNRSFETSLAILAARGQTALAAELREKGPAAAKLAKDFVKNPADAIEADETLSGEARKLVGRLADTLKEEFEGIDSKAVGKDVLEGLLKGVTDPSLRAAILRALKDLSNDIAGTVRSTLVVSSPSKVFEEIGRDVIRGFRIGFENEQKGGFRFKIPELEGGGGSVAVAGAGPSIQLQINNPSTRDLSADAARLTAYQEAITGILFQRAS